MIYDPSSDSSTPQGDETFTVIPALCLRCHGYMMVDNASNSLICPWCVSCHDNQSQTTEGGRFIKCPRCNEAMVVVKFPNMSQCKQCGFEGQIISTEPWLEIAKNLAEEQKGVNKWVLLDNYVHPIIKKTVFLYGWNGS